MNSYLDIIRRVLEKGKRQVNRTGTDTFAVPNIHFSHDMSMNDDGEFTDFPLLTTKKMAFKTLSVELEGFIKGITTKKWYQDRGCNIWDGWANPEAVQAEIEKRSGSEGVLAAPAGSTDEWRKRIQARVDDLGPIYGYQWRRFNQAYDESCDGCIKQHDQLAELVEKLHSNPNDRRLVVSAWNPGQLHKMALPPCHLLYVVTVIDGELSLHWTQRSCDLMLGVPFNIASYALLMCLLCREGGFKPGNLSGILCNCHIYENHLEAAEEQVHRTPYDLPRLKINSKGIFDWTYDQTELIDYKSHPKLEMQVAI